MKIIIVLLLFAISSLCSGCATIEMMDALPGNFVDVTSESIYNVEQLQSNNICYKHVNRDCLSYYLPLETTKKDDHGRYLRIEVPENNDRLGVFFKENSRTINIQNLEIVDKYNNREHDREFRLTVNFTSDEPLDKVIRTLCLDVDKSISKPSNCGIESSHNANNAYFYSFRSDVRIGQATEEEITNALDKVDVNDSIDVKYKYISQENTNYNGVFVCVLLPVTLIVDVIFLPVSVFYVFGSVMGR